MSWSSRIGIWRSWLIYYAKPFNRRKLNKFYRQFLQPGDLAFDIGAHLGNRSQAWLDLGVQVIAAEPQPVCIQYLKNRFRRHPGFRLLPVAIGANEDELEFKISSLHPTISTARGEDWQNSINRYGTMEANWDQSIRVKQYSLNQLISWYGIPRFCKIDTEGFEWEVIQGLHQAIPQLSIEFLAFDKQRVIWCIQRLMSLGEYSLNFSFGETQRWYWKDWQNAQSVILFIEQDQYPRSFGDIYFKLN